jgi:lipopolysaccharide export system protein LptA
MKEILLPNLIKTSSSLLSSTQTNDQTIKVSSSTSSLNTMNTKTITNNDNTGLTNDLKRRARLAD